MFFYSHINVINIYVPPHAAPRRQKLGDIGTWYLFDAKSSSQAQYIPPTPTRLNCRVESRRRLNAPVGSRDPVYNFLCCWAIELGGKWRHSGQCRHYWKSYQYRSKSRSQTGMQSVWSVFKLSTESIGSRRELVANSVHTADTEATQLNSWVESASAVCIEFDSSVSGLCYSQSLIMQPAGLWWLL